MADTTEAENEPLRSVTFKLSQADIDRLREIVEERYPEDRHMTARVIREMIRLEHQNVALRKRQREAK